MKLRRVLHCNQAAAERLRPRPDWAMISITAPAPYGQDPTAALRPGWRHLLRLQFEDVRSEGPDAMTPAQAREVVDFVAGVAPRVEVIAVHCAAGLSRSPAVARWIAEAYRLPLRGDFSWQNPLVYRRLVAAHRQRDAPAARW